MSSSATRRTLALFALTVLPGGACTEGSPTPHVTRYDTLPSGAIAAVSGETGAWEAGRESPWTLELLTTLGGSQAQEDPFLFSSIRGLAVDDQGRLYVLEAQACQVRVFDLQGRHIRSMGACGQGPGELLRPTGMILSPEGDIWITDPGNARFQPFDSAGSVLPTVPFPTGITANLYPGGFDADGNLRHLFRTPEGFFLHRIEATTGATLDSLPLPPDQTDRFILRRTENGQLTGIGVYSIPFAPERFWAFQGNTLWTGAGESYQVAGLSMAQDLDTTRVVVREVPREPVGEAEIQGYWETVGLIPSEVRQLDLSKIPSTKRSFERFFVDRDGYLWVARWAPGVYGSRQSGERLYDVFTPEGLLLGTLPLEVKPYPTPWVEGDLLVGVHTDALDVPVVVVYRLEGKTRGEQAP